MPLLQPVPTVNMSARLAWASWITESRTRQRLVFWEWIKPTMLPTC